MATIASETTTPTARKPAAGPPPYHVTAALYERMIDLGVVRDNEPVYLWRGRLVQEMTKGRRHNFGESKLTAALVQTVPNGWFVRVEQPVTLADDSFPEPDFSVVRGDAGDYLNRDVLARDVALVVEVADSSLPFDTGEKLEDHAKDGIPVYWVVNIPAKSIDVYTEPSGPRESGPSCYAQRRSYRPDENVSVVLDGREVGRVVVADMLP